MVGGHGGCGQGGVGHGSRCSRGDGIEGGGGWYPGNVFGGSPEKNGRRKKDIEITNIPFKTHLIINKQLYSAVLRSSV